MKPSTTDRLPVLLVDDEEPVLRSSRLLLASAGVDEVLTLADSRELLPLLERRQLAAIVLDLFMPYVPGTELLPRLSEEYPEIPVIVMTAAQDVETAVECMKHGAWDYLVKPVEERRFISAVKRAVEVRSLRRQVGTLRRYLLSDQLEHHEAFADIVTQSRKMRSIFQYLEAVATSEESVLITGETGVGKEMLGTAVHTLSGRAGELVKVNVAGLDDALFTDTLFGHRKGAYSGAAGSREGLVARARGGTLLLDEIGDLKKASQIKLLRLLQEQEYYPLGSDVPKKADVRIVCATNRDLSKAMGKGRFRADLYFRLSVHQVAVPALRERLEDLPLLVEHFLDEAAGTLKKGPLRAPEELFTLLSLYEFPGNIRELRALLFDAVALHASGPTLSLDRFRSLVRPDQVPAAVPGAGGGEAPALQVPGRLPSLREAERFLVGEAMRRAEDNQGIAAELLGISRTALNRRLAKLGGKDD